MTRVKICGITNREDARAAVEHGADALGFNFFPGTPRYIGGSSGIIELLESVPPLISRVGVCLRPDAIPQEVLDHLDVLQTYDLSVFAGSGKHRIMPAFRLRSQDDLDAIQPALALACSNTALLDAYHDTVLGGGGVTFDWRLASEAEARFGIRVVLAGGLTPENVADAIRQVKPYAVDVSSGVELAQPGRKDHDKLRRFIVAARSAA